MKIHIIRHLRAEEDHQETCIWLGVYDFMKETEQEILFLKNGILNVLCKSDFKYFIDGFICEDITPSVDPLDYSKYKL